MTIQDYLHQYTAKIDRLDCELLIAHALHSTRVFVMSHPEYVIPQEIESVLDALLHRRARHEPLAYILGVKEFYGLDFFVTPDTLIPRPETELMIDTMIDDMHRSHNGKQQDVNTQTLVLDIGTGSGCIITTLAHEMQQQFSKSKTSQITFIAVDISQGALAIAKKNADQHHVDHLIHFYSSNLLDELSASIDYASFETIFIAANLPYLSKTIYDETMPDVKNYEPKSALYSDNEGLAHYENLFQQIQNVHCKPSTHISLYAEISPEQNTLIQKRIRIHFPHATITPIFDATSRHRLIKIEFETQ